MKKVLDDAERVDGDAYGDVMPAFIDEATSKGEGLKEDLSKVQEEFNSTLLYFGVSKKDVDDGRKTSEEFFKVFVDFVGCVKHSVMKQKLAVPPKQCVGLNDRP